MDIFSGRYLRVNKLLLSFVGLWPDQPSSNKDKFYYCTVLGISIIWMPQIMYLFKYGKTMDDFYDVLPTLAGALMCFMKQIGLRCTIKKFKMIVQHVHYDWYLLANHEDMRILIKYIERSRIFTLTYLIFITICATSYVATPLTVPILDSILASNITRPKRLPHPSEFIFFDLEQYYFILYTIACIGYVICVISVGAIDTTYFALLQYTCGMLAILRLIQLINSTFIICLVTDVGFGVIFQCSSCVMIVLRKNTMELMKNVPLLFAQTSRIFFNSWMGQIIIDHSSELSTAAYDGMWYQSSLKTKKMLLFLIAKCQKPYSITLAKLYVISLKGYSTLMRTSVSYVTLMISLSLNDT